MNICKLCGNNTHNLVFCSKKCAASFNNKTKPKRAKKKIITCQDCGVAYFMQDRRRSRCESCYETWSVRWDNVTLGQLTEKCKSKGNHSSWKYSEARGHCRRLNKHRPQVCQVCDYSKHVEMCHIKPLASFPPSAKLADVNDPSNIYILCPNHHWELDNGHLDMNLIR